MRLIAGTVNALYTTSRPAAVALGWSEALLGVGIGAVVALLLGAGAGARSHAGFARAGHGPRANTSTARACAGGAVWRGRRDWRWRPSPARARRRSMATRWAATRPRCWPSPPRRWPHRPLVLGVTRLARPTLGTRAESLLAGRSLAASLARTSVMVAALATAMAMMASVGIMVGSFRETVALWLDVQLRADLYVRPAVPSAAGEYPPLA